MDQNRTLSQLSGKKNCATLTRDQTAGPVRSLSRGIYADCNSKHSAQIIPPAGHGKQETCAAKDRVSIMTPQQNNGDQRKQKAESGSEMFGKSEAEKVGLKR